MNGTMRWFQEAAEIAYAVLLAVGIMGGVWGAVHYLFAVNGPAARLTGAAFLERGMGGFAAIPATLLVVVAFIFWLPRLQSSRPAAVLLGGAVLGGYAFLVRAFTVGI
jgi:hypothetical protein